MVSCAPWIHLAGLGVLWEAKSIYLESGPHHSLEAHIQELGRAHCASAPEREKCDLMCVLAFHSQKYWSQILLEEAVHDRERSCHIRGPESHLDHLRELPHVEYKLSLAPNTLCWVACGS